MKNHERPRKIMEDHGRPRKTWKTFEVDGIGIGIGWKYLNASLLRAQLIQIVIIMIMMMIIRGMWARNLGVQHSNTQAKIPNTRSKLQVGSRLL